MNQQEHEFPPEIGQPATRALIANGITTLKQIAAMTDQELLIIHGVGPKAVKILRTLQ